MRQVLTAWGRRSVALWAVALAAGCAPHAHGPAAGAAGTTLRIGYQKGGSLNLLRLQGTLEERLAPQGVAVQWLNFPAGPQLLEGIGAGSIDVGSAGDTPPIFAQEAGVPLVYVANTPATAAGGRGQAIIVPANSPIHGVADLRGRRVAFNRGSSAHYFVLQALGEAGLKYGDIRPAYMAPPDAQAAFSSGGIDAWAIWDPFLSIAKTHGRARVVRDGTGLPTSGGFYLASRAFAVAHPELVKALLEEAKKAGDWAQAHPHEAAVVLAPNVGLDVPTLELIIRSGYTTSYRPIDGSVVALQQKEADAFYKIGLLPETVDIKQDTLTSQQYARLAPETGTRSASAQTSNK